ncbi:uncharacterized protein LOC119616777 [Kryptolebias marmoratus]|uniref:uncharacterized protein LOC119616777 n=1 Tax=Kryptolebias marmoratus TaxID=37003 RepID=UPI0018ACFEA1|nr:uncharacterized protein LOC119616777 [Kryptolebias marmoratus]
MPLTADVNTEPLKWPIAPDGYIPNSVIRSWRRKEYELSQPFSGEETFFHELHTSNECITNNRDNVTTSTVWLAEKKENEDEMFFEVEQEMSGYEDEKNKNKEDKIRRNKKMDEKTERDKKIFDVFKARPKQTPETGENEIGEFVLQQDYGNQSNTTQRKHLKASGGKSVRFQTRETDIRDSLENTGKTIYQYENENSQELNLYSVCISVYDEKSRPTNDESGHDTPQKELKNSPEFSETNTPPLQDLSAPKEHKEPSIIPTDWLKPSVKSCVASADAVIPKTKLLSPPSTTSTRFTLDASTQHLPSLFTYSEEPPLPPPPPPSPEDLQDQLIIGSPEGFLVKHNSFHLSSSKYIMKDQAQLPLNSKALAFYKKFKACNTNVSHLGKSTAFLHNSKLFSAHRNSLYLNLRSEVHRPSPSEFRAQINSKGMVEQNSGTPFRVALSSIHNYLHSSVQSGRPILPCLIDSPLFSQSPHPDDCNNPMPEWRKTLHKLISRQGFRSSQAAGRYTTEHPVELPSVTQPAGTIPSLQHGQAEAHQRVVQKIQLKNTTESQPCCFNCIIPMASQQNFCTLPSCGKTQYGQLQFDWKRGSEEEKLLRVPPIKLQHCPP